MSSFDLLSALGHVSAHCATRSSAPGETSNRSQVQIDYGGHTFLWSGTIKRRHQQLDTTEAQNRQNFTR